MRHLKTSLAVLGGATVLVLAGNTVALAATGHSLLLGKSNSANATTSITRTTSGSVLKLQSKSATNSPLTVNGKGKVTNLNADVVDGLDSSTLRTHSYIFNSSFTATSFVSFDLPVPNGTYLVSYSSFFHAQSATSGIQCYVLNGGIRTGYSSIVYTNDGWKPALSGTGTSVKTATRSVKVECQSDVGTFDTVGYSPLQIIATPTKSMSVQTISPARVRAGKAMAQR